ncbi:MAG: AEC family transporter [Alphaproteobacteria bacterium]
MSMVIAALAPVAALIALGWLFKRRGFPGDGFWAPAERLTYYLLLPALIVGSLGRARFEGLGALPMALALAAALTLGAGAIWGLRRHLAVDGPAFSSLFQGSIRLNGYIGFAGALALWGDAGLTFAAVAVATYGPVVNVLSVAVLSRYAGAASADWGGVAREIARNPLIIACVAGLALSLTGIGLPPVVDGALDVLGRAALALGLLCVGAGLTFAGLAHAGRGIAAVCAVKLVAVPAATVALCALFGVGGAAAGVAVLFAALPTATSAFILARQMGGDATLMAQVIAATHLAAALTLPMILVSFT